MTITSCTFAVAGMSTGHIKLFNMQSGLLHRGELGRPRGVCGLLLLYIVSVGNALIAMHLTKTLTGAKYSNNYMHA